LEAILVETGTVTLPAATATKVCDLPAGGPYSVTVVGTSGILVGFTNNVGSDGLGLPVNSTILSYTFTVNSIGNAAELWAYKATAGSISFLVAGGS
jgi:hypothetical protein